MFTTRATQIRRSGCCTSTCSGEEREEHEKERETEKLMKRQQKVKRPDDTKEAAEHSTRFCYI
ncbi:hypothetical protein F2Q70_00009612 [Brassica cretica]|uniref:Uncharacterized protein n=1 Tax=Brassica cretica TaxID=69181 RepID=A0A8S9M554_BRACR|nr:hypothetical protein F2Q70_00009612 [Brassica cretica]